MSQILLGGSSTDEEGSVEEELEGTGEEKGHDTASKVTERPASLHEEKVTNKRPKEKDSSKENSRGESLERRNKRKPTTDKNLRSASAASVLDRKEKEKEKGGHARKVRHSTYVKIPVSNSNMRYDAFYPL